MVEILSKINSSSNPAPIGPFSQATKVQFDKFYLLFSSGNIGINNQLNLVSDNVKDQAIQTMKNIQGLLK